MNDKENVLNTLKGLLENYKENWKTFPIEEPYCCNIEGKIDKRVFEALRYSIILVEEQIFLEKSKNPQPQAGQKQ